jgi:hypothetical protein
MDKYEELLLQAERVEALQEIRNLMGKYSYLHSAFRNKEYVELWAKREDDVLIMPFGKFVGWEGIRHCYVDYHGDRNNPEDYEELRGLMMLHLMDTEVIEVAADGKTAKGAWLSPGTETAPQEGKEKGAWCWGKYEVEFIKEDGVWKFWHMTLFPLFLSPYNRSWGEPAPAKMLGQVQLEDPQCLPLDKPMWEYTADAEYPENEPAIPEPYAYYEGI